MSDKRAARWGWWVWVAVLAVLSLAALGAHRWFPSLAERNIAPAASRPVRPIPVQATSTRRGDLPLYLDALGTVTAYRTVTVRPRVDGQLTRVSFEEGQMVHAGDVLAQIDPRPYQADLDSKIAAQGQAAAQVDMARITYNRLKELMPEQSASPIEFQQAEATVKQMDAALDGARANVETARLNLEWCRIIAPITGRIGLRLVDAGNLVHANEPGGIATIAQLQPISVVFSLPQTDLPQVMRAGGGRGLAAEAFTSDLKTRLATGTLEAIDNQIDPGTGTARFKATFANEDNALFPNQFVNVRLLVETRKNAVLAPSIAIQRSGAPGQSTFVYVIRPDDTVELRPVKAGPVEGGLTVVEDGLSPDERVVIDGVDKLTPGATVAVRPDAPSASQSVR